VRLRGDVGQLFAEDHQIDAAQLGDGRGDGAGIGQAVPALQGVIPDADRLVAPDRQAVFERFFVFGPAQGDDRNLAVVRLFEQDGLGDSVLVPGIDHQLVVEFQVAAGVDRHRSGGVRRAVGYDCDVQGIPS